LASSSLLYDEAASGNGSIFPGESRTRRSSFMLPDGPRGVGTIQAIVVVDVKDNIAESNGSGTGESNNSLTTTAASTIAPYPDLQVTGLGIDPSTGLQSGSALVVHWSDTNTGNLATPGGWRDLVTIKNLTTGETLVNASIPYDPSAAGNGLVLPGESRD